MNNLTDLEKRALNRVKDLEIVTAIEDGSFTDFDDFHENEQSRIEKTLNSLVAKGELYHGKVRNTYTIQSWG